MLDALKSIMTAINNESANLAGANITGYKRKQGNISSSSDSLRSIGDRFISSTDYKQGSLTQTGFKSDLAIQGEGFFVLFDDSASASFDPNKKLSELNEKGYFKPPITDGTFTVNGNTVTVNTNTDSFNDVLNKISLATGGVVTGEYDQTLNEVRLTNNSGPGGVINLSSGTSNFIDVSRLSGSSLQNGANSNTFIVSNAPVGSPVGVQKLYFTRNGNFKFDDNGFLVNENGLFVAGKDPKTGNLIKIDKKTFDGQGSVTDDFHFSANGILFNDSQLSKEGKQLVLARFANPQGLIGSRVGGSVYESTSSAGKMIIQNPDKTGFGLIKDQSLENSNSDAVDSLSNLGILQRFFPSTMSALKVALSAQDDLNNTIR
jgi:flagellar hook protein FlgE